MNIYDDIANMSMEEYAARFYRDPEFRMQLFRKTDAPIISVTADVWQPLYGEALWSQLHREFNLWTCLQKIPWVRDGLRILLSDPALQGVWHGEDTALPDTVKPTFDKYKTDSKWCLTTWDIFEKAKQHAARNEGIDLGASLMLEYAEMHKEFLNKGILANAETEAAAAGANRYATAPLAIESIDRIIADDAEEALYGGTYTDWYDPYATDIDREDGVGTEYNSVVLQAGTERAISDALLRELIRKCEEASLNPATSFLLTGRDTRDDIAALQQAQLRYLPTTKVQFGVNGIQTAKGQEVGFKVASYDDYPIIVDKHCPKDTKSRIYMIDSSKLKIKTMFPTMLLRSGGAIDWLKIDRLKDMYAYLTVAELECTNFKCLGKIRDLL